MNGWRATLTIVGLFVALLGYILATGSSLRATAPAVGHPRPLLDPSADPSHIELSAAGRTLAADVRRAEPGSDIESLLDTLRSLPPLMTIDAAPADPRDYGLGPGSDRLRILDTTDRELLDLEIGSANPSSTGIYVRRRPDPEVLLVGAVLRWEISKILRQAP